MSYRLTGIKRVAVVMGGPGSERNVSLASGAGVAKALQELGLEVLPVDVTGETVDLPEGVDLAFNVIHGTFGEDGRFQQVMEAKRVPYTGEGVAGSQTAIDKIASKKRFVANGVPTPASETISPDARPQMALPYVVKAPREGSSVGVFIVKTEQEAEEAFSKIKQYTDEVLVEQFAPGRELTVGILGDQALPIIEISPKEGFYDFDNKYPFLASGSGTGKAVVGADHACPANLPAEVTKRVQEIALQAHRALGLEVYSRVDFVLPERGEPLVLEINTIPGMTESSLLPEAAAAAGISYPELCRRIIELSLKARPA